MIVIVTDSSAYLTKQEAKDFGALYVPMTYSVGSETHTEGFIDMFSFKKEDFDSDELKTSQPGMAMILHRFARLRASNCEVLCITLSSRLSGMYSNACVCARELGDKGIRIVDSKSAAGGVALMVKEARRMISSGMSLDEVADALEELKTHIQIYFSVRDLAPLRRSGRLGFVRQSVGTILNQRPILTCQDGAVVCCEVVRGANEQIRRLVEKVPANAREVTVQHVAEPEAAAKLVSLLEEKCDQMVPLRSVGPVLGIHLGFDVISTMWLEP